METHEDRVAMFEKVLETLGFTSEDKRFQFTEDGHRKLAVIKAVDLYGIIEVIDVEDIYGDEHDKE